MASFAQGTPRRNPIQRVGSAIPAPGGINTTGGAGGLLPGNGVITNTGPGGPDPNPTAGGLVKAGPGAILREGAPLAGGGDPNPSAPPPPPVPMQPNVAGTAVTPYGPGNDLRGGAVLPAVSERAGGASGMVDSAAQAIGSGPGRQQIAMDRLSAFDTAAQPMIRDKIQAVGRSAAKFGRLGMGDTGIEATRPFTDYLTQRDAYSKQLAADTAEGEIGDRFRGFDALSGYERGVRGFEAGERDEVRGERDFQSDMARDALNDAFRERQFESGEFSDDYNRALQEYLLQLGVDPTGAFLGISNQFGNSAASSVSGAGNILADILARQGK